MMVLSNHKKDFKSFDLKSFLTQLLKSHVSHLISLYANFFSNACITSTNTFTLSSGKALYKEAR
ncbi:MAG: hypothetical protein JWP12_284 [Bacteroidetes bacterium]|nr:hypothetical protein [Bacteroidota bacterium]